MCCIKMCKIKNVKIRWFCAEKVRIEALKGKIFNFNENNENQCVPECLWRRGVLDTALYDKICQGFAAGRWFSSVSCTNKTNRHDITEILLKMALNTIILTLTRNIHRWPEIILFYCICLPLLSYNLRVTAIDMCRPSTFISLEHTYNRILTAACMYRSFQFD